MLFDSTLAWISAAGTSWATMALSLKVEPEHRASARATQIASNENAR
jgi:hypothetical protein